jgi:hypothetical protein
MRHRTGLLPIFISFFFAASLASGAPPAGNSPSPKESAGPAPRAKLSQPTPAPSAPEAASSRGHTFVVNDEKGVLLKCDAPELETNPETDLFKGCTLAPGRTLDDVMHTFIQGIHYVQKQHEQERAQWQKEQGEQASQKAEQK